MATISLCMIVRDEEDVLARCLESVAAAVDEIIIVDTGSQDMTREIARRYTEKVYDFVWCDDFSAARNFSFAQGTMDYLFWLDADDVLPPASQTALMALKEKLTPDVNAVKMPYHVTFDAQGAPSFIYERERLIKNHAGFSWKGAVHEAIAVAGTVLHAEAVIVEHHKQKAGDPDRNLRIYEKQLHAGAVLTPREQYYYARELYYHHRYEEAAAAFQTFLAMPDGWLENRLDAYPLFAFCLEACGKGGLALQVLLQSLAEAAPRAGICCEIGRHLFQQGKYAAAIFWYESALNCHAKIESGAFLNLDHIGYTPYMQLCVCYYRLGNIAAARKCHMQAAKIKPDAPAVRYNEAFFATISD